MSVVVAASAAAAQPISTAETAYCASLGAKRPGTTADRAMARHLFARFYGAGLRPHIERFHMPVFDVERQSIEVVSPTPMRVPGQVFAYSGTGTVEAEVVYVGVGRSSDYLGVDARGKIVMVDSNEAFRRSSQLAEVLRHGGRAMLYVSGSPQNLVQVGAVRWARDMPAPILAMTVGADDGDRLKTLARGDQPLRMRLSVAATRRDAVGRNVVAIRRGSTYPDRYIVVGAHYDSWYSGAVDNCSAVGSLLHVIDAARSSQPAYSIIFAAWDAEEPGLTGSYDWLIRHRSLLPRIVLNENLEMTSAATYAGTTQLPGAFLNIIFGTASPAMNAVMLESAARNGYIAAPTTATGVRAISGGIIPTDLQPFYTAGVQGFSTYSSTPYYHTTEDTYDKLNGPALVRVSGFLADFLTDAQRLPPEAYALREVPRVEVAAPPRVAAGAPFAVDVTVTDPAGHPVEGSPVYVLLDERVHWPEAAGDARDLGNGHYRYEVPVGATRGGTTTITATAASLTYAAEGYGEVEVERSELNAACGRVSVRIARSSRVTRRGVLLRGTRAGCGRVLVSIAKRSHGRCRFLTRRHGLTRARRCSASTRLAARARGAKWRYRRRVRLPAGSYVVRAHVRGASATRRFRVHR